MSNLNELIDQIKETKLIKCKEENIIQKIIKKAKVIPSVILNSETEISNLSQKMLVYGIVCVYENGKIRFMKDSNIAQKIIEMTDGYEDSEKMVRNLCIVALNDKRCEINLQSIIHSLSGNV